ncbi:hypothetical protein B0T17DRAFT_502122 [Bombardia bombarda]|uniref:Uncharacterized protein n=1 Tax=Bombardia bombarda TaxID=252184 RepID=A0AA39XIZ3_9PEZI|nr:hypothetical protein B0T17DRAFT_502122 [Bombardia bombarda]
MSTSTNQLVWLVTGCSSGFGEEFVHQIVGRGDLIIATGRNVDKIKHLEQAGVSAILRLDVTDSQQVINETMEKAIAIFGRIDVLVNNAGTVVIGTWEDLGYLLGIKTLLVEPGAFRTRAFFTDNVTANVSVIPDYTDATKAMISIIADTLNKQLGDQKKAVTVVLDMVRREGCAKGLAEMPPRIPLGKDAYDMLKVKCDETLKILEGWKPVISGMDL